MLLELYYMMNKKENQLNIISEILDRFRSVYWIRFKHDYTNKSLDQISKLDPNMHKLRN